MYKIMMRIVLHVQNPCRPMANFAFFFFAKVLVTEQ